MNKKTDKHSKGPGLLKLPRREFLLMDYGRCVTIARRFLRLARTALGEGKRNLAQQYVHSARNWGKQARQVYAEILPSSKSRMGVVA